MASQEKGLKHEDVYFLDIGGNIGTFSLAAAAHGFSVITFEPMLSNRMAFQLSLCSNPGLEERVTLIGKVGGVLQGLGLLRGPKGVWDGSLLPTRSLEVMAPASHLSCAPMPAPLGQQLSICY